MNDNSQPEESASLELPPDAPEGATKPEAADTGPRPISPGWRGPHLPRAVLIIVALLIILSLIGLGAQVLLGKKTTKTTTVTINTQSLDNGTLTKLTKQTGADKTKQQLVITPDTVFVNNVTTNQSLSVGGSIQVNGTANLQGSTIIGGNLAVRGSLSVGGSLSADSLNVGVLAVTNLTASGNLNFGGHLVPSGAEPSVTASVSDSAGTVTISGNDTAGTVTINIGNGTLLPGEMAIIHFHTAFSSTPKVQLTPINVDASGLNYYATRATGLFTINTSTTPTANTSYVFDYLVTQ